MDVRLRPLQPGDGPQVAALQRLSFGAGTDPYLLGKGLSGAVASLPKGTLVGYALVSHRLVPRAVVLLSLAVHPEFRRMGWGRTLLAWSKLLASRQDRPLMVIVGADNRPMRCLLESLEFGCCRMWQGICTYQHGERQHDGASSLV